MLSLSLSLNDAQAQTCDADWLCERMFNGSGNDLVMASIVRSWGPTDDVVIGYEVRHPNAGSQPVEFYIKARQCDADDCSTPINPYGTLDQVGDRVLFGVPMMPAMSIHKTSPQTQLEVDVVLRDRWDESGAFCGSTTTAYANQAGTGNPVEALDLSHALWTEGTASGPWLVEGSLTNGTNACEDRGYPYDRTRQSSGMMSACWRYDDRLGGDDEIHCADETGVNAYALETVAPHGTTRATRITWPTTSTARIGSWSTGPASPCPAP